MSVEFNSMSLASLSQMHTGLSEPIPVAQLSNHDRFPSWDQVLERNDDDGRRFLFRCAEGGFRWVLINEDGMAYRSKIVTDEEARQIWITQLLDFSDEEIANLKSALQPGVDFKEALKTALGWRRVMKSFFETSGQPSSEDGTRECLFCAHDGGVVLARVRDEDTVVSSRLLQGREAWDLIQPLVDPQGD